MFVGVRSQEGKYNFFSCQRFASCRVHNQMHYTLVSTSSPMQSGAIATFLPISLARRSATGLSENLSSGPFLGRPRCDDSRTCTSQNHNRTKTNRHTFHRHVTARENLGEGYDPGWDKDRRVTCHGLWCAHRDKFATYTVRGCSLLYNSSKRFVRVQTPHVIVLYTIVQCSQGMSTTNRAHGSAPTLHCHLTPHLNSGTVDNRRESDDVMK